MNPKELNTSTLILVSEWLRNRRPVLKGMEISSWAEMIEEFENEIYSRIFKKNHHASNDL